MPKTLTDLQKKFVENNRDKMTVDEMVEIMHTKGVDNAVVQKYLDENPVVSNSNNEGEQPKPPNVMDLFVRKTDNGRNGVAVMTQTASMLGDTNAPIQENKPIVQQPAAPIPDKAKGFIQKIK